MWGWSAALGRIEAQLRFLVREAVEQRQRTLKIMSAQDDMDAAIADLKTATAAEAVKLDSEVAALAAAATNAGVPQADVEARVQAIKAITQGINDKLAALASPDSAAAGGATGAAPVDPAAAGGATGPTA